MPDEAGLEIERGGFDSRRGNAGDVSGERDHIGGDVTELGVVFDKGGGGRGRGGGGGREDGDGVGYVDAGIPEAVGKLPDMELE